MRGNAQLSILTTGNTGRGRVTVMKGAGVGSSVTIGSLERIRIGRNSKDSELALPSRNISRLHCTAEYDGMKNMYIITDYSTNGTFIGEQRLPKGIPVMLPPGTVLMLAGSDNQIELF